MTMHAPLTPSQIAYLADVLPPLPDRRGAIHRTRSGCECLPCRAKRAEATRPRNARWRAKHREQANV